MPRPQKGRRVCQMPVTSSFRSSDSGVDDDRTINLTVDEYETIRLIDYVGCTQEECARQMKVARSTVQGIYNDARRKIARFIVEATKLKITGGFYELCEKKCGQCNFNPCSNLGLKKIAPKADNGVVKIAVTYEDGTVFQHFGYTKAFKVYEVKSNSILSSKVVETLGKGHGALAEILHEEEISVLICGGIGGGAKNALGEVGIQIFSGASGDADKQVESLLNGSLSRDNTEVGFECSHQGTECEEYACEQKCS